MVVVGVAESNHREVDLTIDNRGDWRSWWHMVALMGWASPATTR